MKKITAIVLALVLVFAFAGSALALTNHQPAPVTPETAKITLDLQVISYITGLPAAGGVISWAAINADTKAFLEGQAIYFNAQVNQGATAAAADVISTLFKAATGASLNIASTGVDFSLASVGQINTSSTGVVAAAVPAPVITGKTAAGFTTAVAADADAADYIFNYTFNGVVTAASPVVTAKLTVGPGYESVIGTTYDLYTDALVNAYDVTKTDPAGDTVVYTVAKADGSFSVAFTLKTDDGLLDSMAYDPDGAGVTVAQAVTRVVDVGGATHWAFDGVANTTYAANLDAVLAFFGFDYALNGQVWDIDFLSKANFAFTDTVNVKTATATINDGDGTDVPVTGDSASVFGFVMIGVAIVAAASLAVVAKKAR